MLVAAAPGAHGQDPRADDGAGDQAAAQTEQRQVERLDGEAFDGEAHGAGAVDVEQEKHAEDDEQGQDGEGEQAVDGVHWSSLAEPAILMRDA